MLETPFVIEEDTSKFTPWPEQIVFVPALPAGTGFTMYCKTFDAASHCTPLSVDIAILRISLVTVAFGGAYVVKPAAGPATVV